jgi:L-aspartate oxidase
MRSSLPANNQLETPVLIVGSGVAGMMLALNLARHKIYSTLVCKATKPSGASYYAQGGISAVINTPATGNITADNITAHVADTVNAGAGLTNSEVSRQCAQESAKFIAQLEQYGVQFTRDMRQRYHLNQEGGHTQRRIVHVQDQTGKQVSQLLLDNVIASKYIRLLSAHLAIDIIKSQDQCVGAYLLDINNNQVITVSCKNLVLATGGASKAYLYSTNPDTASGDGIAIGWRAGARIANLEFNQFHPTALYHPSGSCALISEAVRGEGGKLLLASGSEFMHKFDDRAELAPRDIVARAIDAQLKASGDKHVYLDISHKDKNFITNSFPSIYSKCRQFGIDITTDPIPVVPAAHYTCGGVVTDLAGRTSVANLYAIGETACTGLHGANRLASNSLLECGVMATQSAKAIVDTIAQQRYAPQVAPWDESYVKAAKENILIAHNWHELRSVMWDYVGIVRSVARLKQAQLRVQLLAQEVDTFYQQHLITSDLLELRNLVCVAGLMIRCALSRKESRGLHYCLDYPDTLAQAADTYLTNINIDRA